LKGLILSGGKGTRLRPLTFTSAKQLIPVANKPILFYGIEFMKEAGIVDIGIVVGDTKEEIKDNVGDGSRWGVEVTYIEQEAPLGLAHAVKISRDFLGDERFCMYLGDNLLKNGIKGIVEAYQKSKSHAMILLTEVDNPRQFGVAELKPDGAVNRLVEKPKEPMSNLALVGVYLFDRNIFTAVNAIKPSWRNELEITDAIQYLIEEGYEVTPSIVEGWWKDTGKLEDLLEANRLVLEDLEPGIEGEVDNPSVIDGPAKVGKNSRIINSKLVGPLVIGNGVLVEEAYIGPFTSIADNCFIRKAYIENSILLESTRVADPGLKIVNSLTGKGAQVIKSADKPGSMSIMLGDKSSIWL
jgi:glucose-1-phosphate thymidylyltransferase